MATASRSVGDTGSDDLDIEWVKQKRRASELNWHREMNSREQKIESTRADTNTPIAEMARQRTKLHVLTIIRVQTDILVVLST